MDNNKKLHLYRCWDTKNNEWVQLKDAIRTDLYEKNIIEPKKNIIMSQFIGIKDKGGSPIFVGDILIMIGGIYIRPKLPEINGKITISSVMKYIKKELLDFCIVEEYNNNDYSYTGYGLAYAPRSGAIIGNIYQNQELKELAKQAIKNKHG